MIPQQSDHSLQCFKHPPVCCQYQTHLNTLLSHSHSLGESFFRSSLEPLKHLPAGQNRRANPKHLQTEEQNNQGIQSTVSGTSINFQNPNEKFQRIQSTQAGDLHPCAGSTRSCSRPSADPRDRTNDRAMDVWSSLRKPLDTKSL